MLHVCVLQALIKNSMCMGIGFYLISFYILTMCVYVCVHACARVCVCVYVCVSVYPVKMNMCDTSI